MALPTYISQSSPETGSKPVIDMPTISTQGLVKGLQAFGQASAIEKRSIEAELNKRQAARDQLWENEQVFKARKDMSKYFAEASRVPSKGIVEIFAKDWGEYTDKLLKDAPSEDVANSLADRLGALETELYPKALGIEVQANALFVDKTMQEVVKHANDLIAIEPSMKTLNEAKANILSSIDSLAILVDSETVDAYKSQLVQLNLQAVDLWMIEDPSLARQALDDAKGIPADIRAAKLKSIENAEQQGRTVDRALYERDRQSYLTEVATKGTGSFDIDGYVASLPASQRVGVKTEFNDDTAIAQATYKFNQEIKGKSANEIDLIFQQYVDTPVTTAVHRQEQLISSLYSAKEQRKNLIKSDPFTAVLDSPVLSQLWEEAKDSNIAETVQDTITAALQLQTEMGVPKYSRKVAPVERLKSIAATINRGSPEEKINEIKTLWSVYGQYYPDLFRNLAGLPSDSRISTNLLVVQEHISPTRETPAWVYTFLQGADKSYSDLGIASQSDITALREEAATKSFNKLKNAMFGYSGVGSTSVAADIQEAIAKYAATLMSGGMKQTDAIKKASADLIDSRYKFGEANNHYFGMPANITDAAAEDIEIGLNMMLKESIQEKYAEYIWSDKEVKSTATTPPFNISLVSTKYNDFGLTGDETGDYTAKIVSNAIEDHGYWGAARGQQGVILMSMVEGASQGQAVLGHDGEPIYLSFEQVFAWRQALKAEVLGKLQTLPVIFPVWIPK